ncbi:MAG: putative beta-lysine N-acetyltransferase [Acidobacteria bacterium]|nr:putative beta-lysine N-acetyltransferase [Acidobacteriota bacterium]
MTAVRITAGSEIDTRLSVDGQGYRARAVFSGLNRRVHILDYEGSNLIGMVEELAEKALDLKLGKIFVKAPVEDRAALEAAGMQAEATISGYFNGKPAVVMSRFLDQNRRQRPAAEEEESILRKIRSRPADPSVPALPDGYLMRVARPEDADELAALYDTVFKSYPFPITDPGFLIETMLSDVVYRIVRDDGGSLIAAASADTIRAHHNAEMTDFATLPDRRGLGLAQHTLAALEEDMAERDIRYLYTIARARSAGMNRVFYNRGYEWTGTLVKNCHIAGRFENMHVWCKTLR